MFSLINLILTIIILVRLFKFNNFFYVEQRLNFKDNKDYDRQYKKK